MHVLKFRVGESADEWNKFFQKFFSKKGEAEIIKLKTRNKDLYVSYIFW
jgi:hypothetical protein